VIYCAAETGTALLTAGAMLLTSATKGFCILIVRRIEALEGARRAGRGRSAAAVELGLREILQFPGYADYLAV
jgi:hypothetical protein